MADGGMSEAVRRVVAPIYEALESGNFKQALQMCNKILKKQPEANIAKALKALTLERMDKLGEAIALCNEIRAIKPVDLGVLQAMSYIYKQRAMYDDLVQIYDQAFEQLPQEESLGHHVFMSAVRANNFLKQQQVATKLYKTHANDKYLFWSIMSLLIQAQEARRKDPNKVSLQLTLADKMIEKAMQDKRINSYEQLQLYLHILREKNDLSAVLNVLESDLAKQFYKVENDRKRTKLRVLIELERWQEALQSAQELLRADSADEWSVLSAYLDAWFHVNQDISPEQIGTNSNVAAAEALLFELAQSGGSRGIRGPLLAQIEFKRRLLSSNPELLSTSVLPLLVAYFERFGSKFMCFADLRAHIACLNPHDRQSFIEAIQAQTNANDPIQRTRRSVAVEQIQRFFRPSDTSVTARLSVAADLIQKYRDALPLGKDLASSERQHGDDFLILAVHELIDAFLVNDDLFLIIRCVVLLEAAIEQSRANFQLRWLAIRLFIGLGAIIPALYHFKKLETKHIQHDTLSYLVVDHLADLASFDTGAQRCEDVVQFFESSNREVPEQTTTAYDRQTYSKIREFIDFRARVDQSLHRVIAALELHRISIISPTATTLDDVVKEVTTVPSELQQNTDETFWSSRRDNRDRTVMVTWDGPSIDHIDLKLQRRFKAERKVDWARKQSACLNVINKAYANDVSALDAAIAALQQEQETGKSKLYEFVGQTAQIVSSVLKHTDIVEGSDIANRVLSYFSEQQQASLSRYTKAKTKADRFFDSSFIPSLIEILEIVGNIIPLVHVASQALATNKKSKKDKSSSANILQELVDALMKATSNVRTLAQAGLSDVVEELQRTPEDLVKTFLHRPEDGSSSEYSVVVSSILKSVQHSLTAISKEADRKSTLTKALKASFS